MSQKIATPYKRGERFDTAYGDLKIMSIADNYVMMRYTAAPPFCMHLVKFKYFLHKIGAKLKAA